jgi:catechol 2,3-dioxygenase-like lactoylglutathione lyase family enzyme
MSLCNQPVLTGWDRVGPRLEAVFADPLVNLFTDDVPASTEFYRDHFGFTEVFRTPTAGVPVHVELVLGTFRIAVSSRAAGRDDHGLDLRPGPPQVDLVFWCEDADEAWVTLRAAGVPGVVEPHDAGPNRLAFLTDPAGHLVSVVSRRPG